MKINSINHSFLKKNYNCNNKNVSVPNDFKMQSLKTDTFQHKTNISFGSSLFEDIILRAFLESLEEIEEEIMELDGEEETLDDLIRVLSKKQHSSTIKANKNESTLSFLIRVSKEDKNTINIGRRFEKAGVKTLGQLETFLRIFNHKRQTNEIFKEQKLDAIKIYGLLDNKEDLSRFDEILLYLYNEESDYLDPDFSRLNKTTEFLKQLGVNYFSDFDKKFEYLKEDFNNFEDISDKSEAIEYLKSTYQDKISQLDDILPSISSQKTKKAQNVYNSINDVIDTLYKLTDKKLSSASQILAYALETDKIKNQPLKVISPYFNNFEHPIDKINFYKFLAENKVSISDFNSLMTKGVVNDPALNFFKISNKEEITQIIANSEQKNEKEAFEFYRNFSDVFAGIYDGSEETIKEIKELIDIIKKFNLKNSDSFIMFFNKINLSKKKTIEPDELKEFIGLFKYSASKDLFKEAKEKEISPIQLLELQKEEFKSVEKEIENFLSNNESSPFAYCSPLELYQLLYDEITQNKNNLSTLFKNIADLQVLNAQEAQSVIKKVKQFSKFFENKQDTLKFLQINGLSLDSQEQQEFEKNCFEIFNCLYDKNDKKSKEQIKYLALSGFLVKSQNLLNDFLERTQNEDKRREILTIIADKKIPSLKAMEKFFKQYSNSPESDKKLLEYLSNLAEETDFSKNAKTLEIIQNKIDSFYIPIKLSSDNIQNLTDADFISEENISNAQFIEILDNLKDKTHEGNFLTLCPFNKNSQTFSSFRISLELAKKIEKSDESYQNIARLLRLNKKDLKLSSDCSDYRYAQEIEKVLPKRFIDFVNSNGWIKYSKDKNLPSLSLHARLRAIDRFALNNEDDINVLYKAETKEKLNNLFKTLYTQTPTEILSNKNASRFIVDFNYESNIIGAVFSNNGEMITIMSKK